MTASAGGFLYNILVQRVSRWRPLLAGFYGCPHLVSEFLHKHSVSGCDVLIQSDSGLCDVLIQPFVWFRFRISFQLSLITLTGALARLESVWKFEWLLGGFSKCKFYQGGGQRPSMSYFELQRDLVSVLSAAYGQGHISQATNHLDLASTLRFFSFQSFVHLRESPASYQLRDPCSSSFNRWAV